MNEQQSTFKRKTGPDRRGTKANSPAEAAVAARARLVNPRQVAVGAAYARLGNVPVLSSLTVKSDRRIPSPFTLTGGGIYGAARKPRALPP